MRHSLLVSVLAGAFILTGTSTALAREKGSPPASVLQSPATASSFDASDCITCHEPAMAKMKSTKHFGLEQSCAACHDRDKSMIHSKDQADGKATPGPSFKSLKSNEINATCLDCHEKGNQENWMAGKHESSKVACTTCHSVHSFKSAKAQLNTKTDSENCSTCHKSVRAQMQRQSHHPVREGKMSCSSCHNPHEGSRPKMLQAESTSELCYQCHAEKRGPFLFEHAPVKDDCSLCHNPHGSNHKRLLVQKEPSLCWNCHFTGSGHFGSGDNFSTEQGVRAAPPGSPAGFPTVNSRFIGRACSKCHTNIHGSNAPSGAYFVR